MTGAAPGPSRPAGVGELLLGTAAAAACFARTFRGPRPAFWARMTQTGALLGAIALARRPELRRARVRARHVLEGTAIAGALYIVFQAGDRAARRIMPDGARDIAAIYDLRCQESPARIAVRLATVIAPAEELFWRGWLQRSLAQRSGRWTAAALAAAAYAGVHVASENPTLVGAAGVAGAYWSALAAAGVDMQSLVVSHLLWDIVIFLVVPTQPVDDARP
ncbi:MAG TPA: CPBP family intramembrane glutamic endopeptidase [Acidimicrobiales bacterium]|nr:CPBP family intramembrane glutamic endopeptidase [Acidimicrobiales bacterium]